MTDLNKIGLNPFMQPMNSPVGKPPEFEMAVDWDIKRERTPYLNPTQISKGTVQTNLGGILDLRDATGGTSVLTYNPDTGVVTILGSLVVNSSNSGTYTNVVLAGTNSITGTMMNGIYGTMLMRGGTVANAVIGTPNLQNGTVGTSIVLGCTVSNAIIGTPAITAGTVNPTVYQIGGTVGADGSFVYVKTVDFVGSATTLGTVLVNKGIITSIV